MVINNEELSSVFILPMKVKKFLKKANAEELKLILYIFSEDRNEFSREKAAEELSLTVSQVDSALSFWRGAGVISTSEAPVESDFEKNEGKDEKPVFAERRCDYSQSELAQAIEKNKDFSSLLDFAQRRLGRLFNPTETALLYGLCDFAQIPYDMIMGIIEYCASLGKTSMRYVEKTALSIYDEGVDSFEKLEEYLGRKKKESDGEAIVKKIIGAEKRAFTKTERQYVQKWFCEYQIPEELIHLAYERTINNISKPSVSYMAKIIEAWHKDGINTAKEAAERQSTEKKGSDNLDFDLDDFIQKPEN